MSARYKAPFLIWLSFACLWSSEAIAGKEVPGSPREIARRMFHTGWYNRLQPNGFSLSLEEAMPLLSPTLAAEVKDWYKARDHLYSAGPDPGGNFDPLVQSYWLVTSVKIDKAKVVADHATVVVHLKRSSQGMFGTERSQCRFVLVDGRWLLEDIIFARMIVNPIMKKSSSATLVLSQELRTQVAHFYSDYDLALQQKKRMKEMGMRDDAAGR